MRVWERRMGAPLKRGTAWGKFHDNLSPDTTWWGLGFWFFH
jgi:hypothetical protein